MINYLSGGFSPIPYAGFKAYRAEANNGFTSWEDENVVILTTVSRHGQRLLCIVDKINAPADHADYAATMAPYANAPVQVDEVRFETHNFANRATWTGDTTGDPAAFMVDALTGASYDDVAYQWKDGAGNVVAYLDQTARALDGSGCVWRRASDDAVVCQYDAGADAWLDLNGVDRTSSRYIIAPYPGRKITIMQANLRAQRTAVVALDGAVHYRVFSYYPPAGAVVQVRDWVYPDLGTFEAGSNEVRPHGTDDLTYVYDYTKTPPPVLDANALQRLELSTDNHRKVTGTTLATATFIAINSVSF